MRIKLSLTSVILILSLLNFFRLTLKYDYLCFNQRMIERVWKAYIPCILWLSKYYLDMISKENRLRQLLLLWVPWYFPRSHLIMKHLSCFLKLKAKIYYSSFKIVLYLLLTKIVYFIFIITYLRTLSYLLYSHKTSLNL